MDEEMGSSRGLHAFQFRFGSSGPYRTASGHPTQHMNEHASPFAQPAPDYGLKIFLRAAS